MPPTIIPRICPRWTGLLILAGFAGPLLAAEDPADLEAVWRLGAQGSFTESRAELPDSLDTGEARFTKAVLLFNRQPRSEENLIAAAGLLAALAQDGTTLELRARSLYFQARAESLRNPDGLVPVRLYEQLWRDYPEQPYGQRALVHLLLGAFYTPAQREAVLAEVARIEQQADALTDRVVRSHFHQTAARGYLHLGGDDARALEHLLQVSELGVSRREALGDLHVSIGQLAGEQGRQKIAREHYAAFLQEFPHDPRAYTVRALLKELSP